MNTGIYAITNKVNGKSINLTLMEIGEPTATLDAGPAVRAINA